MAEKNNATMSCRATPWDEKCDLTPMEQFLKSNYTHDYDEQHEKIGEIDEYLLVNSMIPLSCPYCGSKAFVKNGTNQNNIVVYKCKKCTHRFILLTGTIFQDHKLGIKQWIRFTFNILKFVITLAANFVNLYPTFLFLG